MLKLFEDILLYERIKDWNKIIAYFDDILPEELNYVTPEQAREWHTFIKRYCGKKTTIVHLQHIFDTTPHFSLKPHVPSLIKKAYMAVAFYRFNTKPLLDTIHTYYNHIVSIVLGHQPSQVRARTILA